MSAIEKIYGSRADWHELFYWIGFSKRSQYCKYFYMTPEGKTIGPIANFPIRADKWLYENCPIDWVKQRIGENLGLVDFE